MKSHTGHLLTALALGLLVVAATTGCPGKEPADVTTQTVEELPEAGEEVLTNEPEQPGDVAAPAPVETEEMVDETPPHVEDDNGVAGEGTVPEGETENPPVGP